MSRYPSSPNPGSIKPTAAPRDSRGGSIHSDTDVDAPALDSDLLGTQEFDSASQTIQGFSIPGCPDKFGGSDLLAIASSSPTPTPASPAPAPPFPSPSYLPAAFGGFDMDKAFAALDDFYSQTATVMEGSDPVSKVHDGGEGPGHELKIRFTLS